MSTGDLPAVARRRVRIAVREARERKGLTQADVAEAMEWSASKIMRIESGEVTISPNDLRPLLAYLGIQDRVRVEELIQDAKASRRRQERLQARGGGEGFVLVASAGMVGTARASGSGRRVLRRLGDCRAAGGGRCVCRGVAALVR